MAATHSTGPRPNVLSGGTIGCTGFLYCDPERVEIVISMETVDGAASMLHLFRAESLEQVARNAPSRFGQWSQGEPVGFSLAPDELSTTGSKDASASAAFYQIAKPFVEDRLDPRWSAADAYYPWVYSGDPGYQVYVARNGTVAAVWNFTVFNGSIAGPPGSFYDQPHRNIPTVAQGNLHDRKKWFQVDKDWFRNVK